MNRPTSETERNALKTAFKRIIQLTGGIDAAATVTRVARSNLNEYGVPQMPDRHVPVDVLLDLERIAGAPLVTEALAASQGFLLMPVAVGEGDVAEALAQVSQGAGQTLSDGLKALRDGMPENERAVVIRDLTELNRTVAHALALLRQDGPLTIVGARAG